MECPYCHEMIEETAQYCPHCGKAVIKSKAEVTPEKEKENLSMAEEGKKSQFQQEKAPKSAASYIKENIPNTENWQEMYLSTQHLFCSLAAPACDGRHHFRCLFLRSSRGGSFFPHWTDHADYLGGTPSP